MTFLTLPTEIVTRIISFLDTSSPLDTAILQKPKTPRALFYPLPPSSCSPSPTTSLPLKNLSLTSHFLRILALPFLFKHSSVHPLRVRRFVSPLPPVSLLLEKRQLQKARINSPDQTNS